MPITQAEMQARFSVVAAAGNTTAGTAATSLGDQLSTTQITDATIGNIFDDITGEENALADVEYRCIMRVNTNGTLTATQVREYISAEVAGGASVAIGLDPIGVTAIGSASPQAATVANEQTAPAGVTFTSPTTRAAGLVVADVPPNSCYALWIRRTAGNNGAVDNDGATFAVGLDTPA